MIVLTRLNGTRFAINDEQIERLEEAPNTIVVLVNGNRYTALESLDEVVEAIVDFRCRVLDAATREDSGSRFAGRQAGLAVFRGPAMPDADTNAVEAPSDETSSEDRIPSLRDSFRLTRRLED